MFLFFIPFFWFLPPSPTPFYVSLLRASVRQCDLWLPVVYFTERTNKVVKVCLGTSLFTRLNHTQSLTKSTL